MSIDKASSSLATLSSQQPQAGGGTGAAQGALNNQTVQASQPGAARAQVAQIPAPKGGFFSRLFSTSDRSGPSRADRKVQESQKSMQLAARKLFDELRQGHSVKTLERQARALNEASKQGVSYGSSYAKLMTGITTSMDMGALHQVKEKLAALDSTELANSPQLKLFKEQIESNIFQRECAVVDKVYQDLSPSLELAVAQATLGSMRSSEMSKTYAMLKEVARDSLVEMGYASLPTESFEKIERMVLMQAIDMHVNPEATHAQQTKVVGALTSFLLEAMPSEDMRSHLMTEERLAGEDVGASARLVMAVTVAWAESLEKGAVQQLTDATAVLQQRAGHVTDVKGFYAGFMAAVGLFREVKQHADINHLEDGDLNARNRATTGLADALSAMSSQEVAQFSDDEMRAMRQAIFELDMGVMGGQFGVREAALMGMDVSAALTRYADSFNRVSAGMVAGDAHVLLSSLDVLSQHGSDLWMLEQLKSGSITQAGKADEDQVMAFREQAMNLVIANMPAADLSLMAGFAENKAVVNMADGLMLIGMLSQDLEFSAGKGAQAMSRAMDLKLLCSFIRKTAMNQNIAPDALALKLPLPTAKSLALSEYGVALNEERGEVVALRPPVILTKTAKDALDLELREFEADSLNFAPHKTYSKFPKIFVSDITRHNNFSWSDEGGGVRPMRSSPRFVGDDVAVAQTDQSLMTLTGLQSISGHRITQVMHQGLLAGVEKMMQSAESPLKLSDGSLVQIAASKKEPRLHLKSDGKGGYDCEIQILHTEISAVQRMPVTPDTPQVNISPADNYVLTKMSFNMNAAGDLSYVNHPQVQFDGLNV